MNFNIPYTKHNLIEDDIKAMNKVLISDNLTQGPFVSQFEKKFSKYVGSKYSIAVSNGTAALHLCCLALGVTKESKVICPTITFASSANCVRFCGGDVLFVDIDKKTLLLDIEKLETLLKNEKIEGIIAVNLAGRVVDFEKLRELSSKYEFWIIEDGCHSPGGYFIDSFGTKQYSGSGNFSDLSIFSFHPAKHIATGEGGMITTNNKELYEKLLLLRTHGIIKESKNFKSKTQFTNKVFPKWYYELQELGFNYRLTDFQAALGSSQLKRAKLNLKKRYRIAEIYHNFFENKDYIINHSRYLKGHAYHLYIIQVKQRDKLYKFLRDKHIYCQIHYYPLHKMPYYLKLYGDKTLLNSELYVKECISIPMFPELKKSEINYILKNIEEFYE